MGVPLHEPTFLILTALAGGPLHGYGVIQEVTRLSDGRVVLRPGTLYGALDRLAEQGHVAAEREEVVDGRLRRYYRLTDEGAAVLDAEARRLASNAAEARRRLHSRPAAAQFVEAAPRRRLTAAFGR
jgi:DNA-binding PadR family transcriptional regulator